MAEAVAPQQQEQQQPGFLATALRMALFYFIITRAIGYFSAPSAPTPTTKGEGPVQDSIGFSNLVWEHDPITLKVYLHSDPHFRASSPDLIWEESSLTYDYDDQNSKSFSTNLTLTPSLQHNGTLYLTALLEYSSSYLGNNINSTYTIRTSYVALTEYREIIQESTVNLISGEAQMDTKGSGLYAMHWKPAIDIYILNDNTVYSLNGVPPQLSRLQFHPKYRAYEPLFYCTDFWVLKEHLIPLNDSLSTVPLSLTFSIIGLFKHSFISQFSMSNEILASYGMGSEGEMEIMKKMFLEANPYFLGLTLFVSLIHTVFEILAFKSDIDFWKSRDSLKGLSTKLLLYNFISTLVISLYLLDSQETSWLVLVPMLLGVLIEFWKLTKGFDVGLQRTFPFVSMKEKESHKEGGTEMYDNVATRYLFYALIPVVIGYSVYSLYEDEYKSWYSWILRSCARFIYTMGFIMMTPQLYINYKLQSVEHMPWKVLTYRALNTFIDDMFAFIISMPTMHRIACFRDDIIFVVYVYQRYKYRVDPNRHYLDTAVVKEKAE